jgi:hypothetical protein
MRAIDYIANLKLSDEQEKGHFNELYSLAYLATGLRFLYEQVQSVEAEVIKRLPKDKQVIIFGNAPQMQGINQDLVACAFHWYAVTVCNYTRLVGWLAYGDDKTKVSAYLKRVLPQVYVWRNKIGSHFARHSPKNDNPATRVVSVMFPIKFENDAFCTQPFMLTTTKGGKQSTSQQDMRWSLTHTHCDLIPRYWPENTRKSKAEH